MGNFEELKNLLPYSDYLALDSMEEFHFLQSRIPYYDRLIRNGNYWVLMFEDGSKLRFTHEDEMVPEYPECIDLTVSNRCTQGCPFCYANCTPDGREADFTLHRVLFDELQANHPGIEIALNINELDSYFLKQFTDRFSNDFYINGTINGEYLIKALTENPDSGIKLMEMMSQNKIRGLGISVPTRDVMTIPFNETLDFISKFKSRIVLHVIAGIHSPQLIRQLSDRGFSILILGFKRIGRGVQYSAKFESDLISMTDFMMQLIKDLYLSKSFRSSFAFDGLALEQLKVREWIEPKIFEKLYSGDEGEFSMYIDLVKDEYSISSISDWRKRFDIDAAGFDRHTSILSMFQDIYNRRGEICQM